MKKIIALALFLALLLTGCATGQNETDTSSDPSASASAAASSSQDSAGSATRSITDSVGRTVEIPSTVETIVPLETHTRMITYLGLADKVVGVGGMSADKITPVTAYAYATKDLWADLPTVGTDAGGATDYYPEEIIAVNPDVILCSYTAELADEIQTKTGIPVVAVPMGTLFGEDYEKRFVSWAMSVAYRTGRRK
jgi:iron complex transport system substrate-binding protein